MVCNPGSLFRPDFVSPKLRDKIRNGEPGFEATLSAWKRSGKERAFKHLQSISRLSDPLQHLLLFCYFPVLQLSISTPHHQLLLSHLIKKKVFLIFMPHRLQTFKLDIFYAVLYVASKSLKISGISSFL